MGITRRGFLGCVAGSLTAGLPLDRPRPVATSPRRVVLDLGEQCALPESLSGYESALAGLGGGASVTHADARAASGCALLIVPAALALRAAAVRAIVTCLGAGATVIIESGAGFATDRDFAAHRVALRDHLRLYIEAPLGLWSAARRSGAIPYVDYTWPSPAQVRDFSRVVPLGRREDERDIIGRVDGRPVALKRRCGRGDLIFLGSPLGPALWAGDAEARRWLFLTVRGARPGG